jgi:hypothetical protein
VSDRNGRRRELASPADDQQRSREAMRFEQFRVMRPILITVGLGDAGLGP